MAIRSLPSSPSLDHLKHQAKDLLKAYRAGSAESRSRFREFHPAFAGTNEAGFSSAKFALSDAQLVVAREYGFESWPKLKQHVAAMPGGTDPGLNAFLEAVVAGNQPEANQLLAKLRPASRSSLCVTAVLGEAASVEALLRRDPAAAMRPGGPRNWEPLMYLSFSRYHQQDPERARGLVQVARTLLAHGADPNTYYLWEFDHQNKLPALWAAACEANHPALVRELLAAGANPNDGESIFHAAEHNHRECLAVLLEFGANLNGRGLPGSVTPLYFILGHHPSSAAATNAFAGIQWLLEHGANPNAPSYEFQGRPIHLAAANGWSVAMFELLFRHGADLQVCRRDGLNAYTLAARHGHRAAIDWLREHGVQTSLTPADEFLAACGRGDETAVRTLLARSPGLIPALTEADRRQLVSAASKDQTEAVRLMLLAGVPVDTRGESGETALHFASWFGNISTVKLLLAHGAPLEIKDTTYQAPPLGWACHGSENCRNPQGDYVAVVNALLTAGAVWAEKFSGSAAVNAALAARGSNPGLAGPRKPPKD